MSAARLLADENVPRQAVVFLRAAGVVVEAVGETMAGANDRQVIAHARDRGFWIVTFDRDYGELVFAHAVAPPPAIIYLRQSPMAPVEIGQRVLALLDDADFVRGHLVVMSGQSIRRHSLPVG